MTHSSTDPQFTIIVVTYNSAHVVPGLLDSIPAAVDHVPVETIVVDNGSSDGTADLLEARDDCLLIRSTNVGYAAGLNLGYGSARGVGPILILNPDVRLRPGSVTSMAHALDRPRVGIVAPRVEDADGVLQTSLRREPSIPRALGLTFTRLPTFAEYENRPADYETAHVADWALGAVLLIARDCYEELGGWDPSFFLYSEETDFCLRARDAGWHTWYEPSALVEHIGKQSGYNDKTHAMRIVNRVRLYRRRHGAVSSFVYWSLAIGSEGYRALLGRRMHATSLVALLSPRRRPVELGCSQHLLPR
jgi:N-acetylglucosaminyl-diphospho-decaprenol L-rhamnosyltransferase